MCRVLRLHPSGYYAWKAQPESARTQDDRRLLGLLKHAWLESGGVYGYRKLTLDMRDLGERCSKHRVAKLLKQEGLQAQRGYRRRPSPRDGQPAVVAPNVLEQQFSVEMPNQGTGRASRAYAGNGVEVRAWRVRGRRRCDAPLVRSPCEGRDLATAVARWRQPAA